jgi:anti-anti-sigma regulatory factor
MATADPAQVCVRLAGELDIAAPVARAPIAGLTLSGRDLVLDLRGLSFVDSLGPQLPPPRDQKVR